MKYAPFSHTKLSTFNTCPMQFKFKYVDRLREESNDAMTRGRSIHGDMEVYVKTQVTDNPALMEFLETDVGVKYKKIIATGDNRAEVRLGLDESFAKIPYGKEAMVNCIIDFIYMEDGVVHLVDWKTGRVPSEQDWSQLSMYALAFLKDAPVTISYVYLDHGVENTRSFTQDDWAALRDEVATRINNIETCTDMARKITWKCKYCGFRNICHPETHGIENSIINI